MRAFGQSIALMGFAVGALGGAQSPPPDPAATVLGSAREALGGDPKMAAVRTVVANRRPTVSPRTCRVRPVAKKFEVRK